MILFYLFLFLGLIQGLLQLINYGMLKIVMMIIIVVIIIIICKMVLVIPYSVKTLCIYWLKLYSWIAFWDEDYKAQRQKQDFYTSYCCFSTFFLYTSVVPKQEHVTQCWQCMFWDSNWDLLHQKIWGQGPVVWDSTGTVGDDVCSNLRSSASESNMEMSWPRKRDL